MKDDLDLYRMSYGDETTDGIYAISLVEDCAIEIDFIYFNKEQQIFSVDNEEKRIVVGPVLIPNQKIYRRDKSGYEYNVYFTQEDVDVFSENFMINGNNNNVTLNHEVTGNGIKMIYFWKSSIENELGFGAPKGSIFAAYKILNSKVWKEVKDGTFKGFSIEFFTTPIKEEYSNHLSINKEINDMSDEEINELLKIIGDKIQSKTNNE